MFEKYGTDYAHPALQLNDLLPSVNQSEASNSILSTLFQRWLTKPNLTTVAGTIGFSRTPIAGLIQENTAHRQAYQLLPVFHCQQGDRARIADWNDVLRKLAFTGVDPLKYDIWGATSVFNFHPPINLDMFVNYSNYYWVDKSSTSEQPVYVTIEYNSSRTNDWSYNANSLQRGWIHKNQIGDDFAYGIQAQIPIIEFEDIEMCRWFKVVRVWKKFDRATNSYVTTSEQPTWTSIDYVPPTLSLIDAVDLDWELQSEILIPVGHIPTSSTPAWPTPLHCERISTDVTNNTARFEIRTTATSGVVQSYLRGQNDIVVFAGSEHAQIVQFTEVEQQTGNQYGTQIDIPLTALTGIVDSVLYAYVGAHSATERNRAMSKKLIKLADGFTSFTPSNGAKLAGTQYRSLYEYKLLGQRKLSKYQLPLFNLYSLQENGAYAEQTTAGYILRYNQDASTSVDVRSGQRVNSAGDVSFTLDLVTTAGQLLTYKRNNSTQIDNSHYTVWRGQNQANGVDSPFTHTPAYVDANRVLTSKTSPGGWEPSKLLTSNPLRETRSQFKLSEVVTHFQNLITNAPGTITISDDGGSHLVSSLLADGVSIPTLIDFIATELTSYRSQFEQQIKLQMFTNNSLRTTPKHLLASAIYQSLRANSITEGGSNSIYDDTPSYDASNNLGYPHYPLTFGILGLANLVDISVEADRKLNHAMIITHDGTAHRVGLSPREYVTIESALSTNIVTGANPIPTSNYNIWQRTSTESYRFESTFFQTSHPSSSGQSISVGATWFDPTTLQASMWTGVSWRAISVNELWLEFNVAEIVLSVIDYQERDIVALIKSRHQSNLPLNTRFGMHVVAATDVTQYGLSIKRDFTNFTLAYEQRDPVDQSVSRLIAPPSATNPFTWNYSSVYPLTPLVYDLYQDLFGTALPHMYPWKMQGWVDKPTWWDIEYADTTGQRRWSSVMWSNIASGSIPIGRTFGVDALGNNISWQLPTYSIIPVNCTSETHYGYAPDDLLPPYINTQDHIGGNPHPLLPYTLIPAQPTLGYPAVQNPTATIGQYLTFPKTYASGNFINRMWRISPTAVSRHLKAAYETDPIQFATNALTSNFNNMGGLRVNPKTNNVSRNTDPLHGENNVIDYSLFTTLTFIARRMNFAGFDASPLATWKTWSTRLAYQTNTLIVPQTLKIYQNCYDLTEYSVLLKKSENIRRIPFSNIVVTLAAIGDSSTSTGRGEHWVFKVACSDKTATTRRRYSPLQQQFVWDDASKQFTVNSTESFKWVDGEIVQLVNPPASLASKLFYISTVNSDGTSNTKPIRLYDSVIDAVSGENALDFHGVFTGPVEFRTIKATFSAGGQVWETVEVDRRSSIQFSFADDILITGVQSLIDFVVSYTEYMQDDGIVVNAGSTTLLDPDTDAVVSWHQQTVKAVDQIFASNGLSNDGYRPNFTMDAGGNFTPIAADTMSIDIPFVEINPFRNAIYFNTPDGVICDFNHTPYVNDPTSRAAIYDDEAMPIPSTELIPLRTDRLTSVVFNDNQSARPVTMNQDTARRIAFGEVSLDFYEHVIIFDQQTSNGLTIFDRFFNLQKTLLNLELQKSTDFYYRPVMGGFVVTDAGTLPNFETIAEYQRNDYNVTESNELVQSTIDSRQMLGKNPLSYFQNIPVTSKTEFQFWQQMIREKGTKDAINAFTRHQLYDTVKYDEFWAWKLGTFGATNPRKQVEMVLQAGDALNTITSFYFSENSTPPSSFVVHQIKRLNQTRWVNFPDYLDQVGQDGVVFDDQQLRAVVSGDGTGFLTSPGDTFHSIEYNTASVGNPEWIVISTDDYVVLSARTVQITGDTYDLRKQAGFRLTGLLPAYGHFSPVRVLDINSKTIIKTMPAWDPANNIHTTAIAHFDYCVDADPALYNRTMYNSTGSAWGARQLGQYMLNSNYLVYKPYFDTTAFPLLDDRTRYWGQLADGYALAAYQWVEASVAPTIRSIDAPLIRTLMYSREASKVEISTHSSPTTFVSSIPLPIHYGNTVLVNLYKPTNSPADALDALTGQEYMIVDIDATRMSFSLIANGVYLVVPVGVSVTGLYITSTWTDAVISEVLPLSHVVYVPNTHSSTTIQLPWTNVVGDTATTANGDQVEFVPHDLTTAAAVINVDGIAVAFSVTSSGALSLYDEYGQPYNFNTRALSVVTIFYSATVATATGRPIVSVPDLMYIDIDIPYVEYSRVINDLPVTSYYYWSASPNTASTIKAVPLQVAVDDLIYPRSNAYTAVHADRQLLTVCGLYGIHQLDSKALAIDIDGTMRDTYVSPSVSKNTNEQWVLFREHQDEPPNDSIWASIVATVTGLRVINLNSTIIVPSPDRVSYDYLYDTSLSYGTGINQTLIPPIRARELFVEFFSTTNPLIDISWHATLNNAKWVSLLDSREYAEALSYVYTYLPSTLLNSFIFVVIREGLYSGYQYDGLFKTSFIALQASQKVVVG